jgi:hypothetical protein
VKTENFEDPDRKCRILWDKELHLNHGETDDKGPQAVGGNTLEDSGSNTGQRRSRAGLKWAQAGVDGENPSTSHEFTFGVGMTFVSYPLVLTPVV